MGIRTTLYGVEPEVALRVIEKDVMDFDTQESFHLDTSAHALDRLIGADAGKRSLHYLDCLEVGDAAMRGFGPDDVAMLLRRVKESLVPQDVTEPGAGHGTVAHDTPFGAGVVSADRAVSLCRLAQALEGYLTRLVAEARGMVSLEV